MRDWNNDASRDLYRRDVSIRKLAKVGTMLLYSSIVVSLALSIISMWVYHIPDVAIQIVVFSIMVAGAIMVARKLGYDQGKVAGAAGLRP